MFVFLVSLADQYYHIYFIGLSIMLRNWNDMYQIIRRDTYFVKVKMDYC